MIRTMLLDTLVGFIFSTPPVINSDLLRIFLEVQYEIINYLPDQREPLQII